MNFLEGLPAVINEEPAVAIARQAVRDVVGEEGIGSQGRPSLGGEDFAFYQKETPGCLVRFGARKDDTKTGLAHSSRFDFDEGVLAVGSAWLARVALLGLEHLRKGREG